MLGAVLLLGACPGYKSRGATLYNATAFPIRIRIWSAPFACGSEVPVAEAFRLRACVELPPDGHIGLYRGELQQDDCELAAVQSSGLPSTLLYWSHAYWLDEGFGHPDDNTVYLERVGERLVLESAPRITAEPIEWELPELACPGEDP